MSGLERCTTVFADETVGDRQEEKAIAESVAQDAAVEL